MLFGRRRGDLFISADLAVLFVSRGKQCFVVKLCKRMQLCGQLAGQVLHQLCHPVRVAEILRLGNDLFHDAEAVEVIRRQFQMLRRLVRARRVLEENACAGFGGDHRIISVLQHPDLVRHGKRRRFRPHRSSP